MIMAIIGMVLMVAGLLVVRVGWREQGIMAQLRSSGHTAEAQVVSVKKDVFKTTSGNTSYHWDVAYVFTALDGQHYEGNQRYSGPKGLPDEGDRWPVTYLPDDPNMHRLSREVQASWATWALMAFGGAFAAVGLGVALSGLGVF